MPPHTTGQTTAANPNRDENSTTTTTSSDDNYDFGIDNEYDYGRDILWPWVRRNAITAMAFRHRAMIQDPSTGDRVRGVAETTIIYFPVRRRSDDSEDVVTERTIWINFRDSTRWKPHPHGSRVQLHPRKNGMIKLYIRDLKPHEVPEAMHAFFQLKPR